MQNRFDNPLPGVPLIESPFFEDLVSGLDLNDETLSVARRLRRDGWAVIDFPDPEFDDVAERIKSSLRPRYDWDRWASQGWQDNEGLRLQDSHTFDADVRRIAINSKVTELLGLLYGRTAWPFQTLSFPVGTQQHFHTDSVHFSSVPERFMCGVWVALEDIGPTQGPLEYYSGSHQWPIYTNEHTGLLNIADEPIDQAAYERLWKELVRVNRVEPTHFHAKKGQALIWTANLLHGGSRQTDPGLTRWSQVTHYYFEGCSYYTPLQSDPFFGQIFFRRPRNVETGDVVSNMYSGHRVPSTFVWSNLIRYGWSMMHGKSGRELVWEYLKRKAFPRG